MKKIYRPDIDALRGIAVLSVLFYHAKFSIFNQNLFVGGFLGVDIFFVLTGFLITTMLVSEYKKNKTINILGFYIRRIRRLIPALLIVILISTFLSYYLLDPQKIKEFAQSVYFSLIFLPNFYFHYFGNFYGQEINLYKPLLHLWSLGIEEQFYVFFPLFLIITFKYFKKFLKYFLFIGFFLSLLFAEYASRTHVMFSFYMLPSRAWEIFLGAILAYFLLTKKKEFLLPEKFISILYFFSLTIIVYFILIFDIYKFKHPTSLTLIPLLAISIMIILGKNSQSNIFFKSLCNKYLIFFGKISYSLYLYHFIIFGFFRNSYLVENTFVKIILIIISILAAYLSYTYVEQVYRNKKCSIKKLTIFIGFFSAVILLINSYYFFNKNLLNKDYVIDGVRLTEWHDTEKIRHEYSKIQTNFFLDNNKKNVLIVGNCHSIETYLSLISNKDNFKDYNFAHISTFIYNFENLIQSNNSKYSSSDIIIFSTRWEENNTNKNFDSLPKLLNKIKSDNKKVILLSNFPEFEYKKNKYNLRKVKLTNYKKKLLEKTTTDLPDEDIKILKRKYFSDYMKNNRIKDINKKLKNISIKNNIKFYDLVSLTCDYSSELCEFRLDKSKDEIFRDYGRYSYNALEYIGQLLYEKKLLPY